MLCRSYIISHVLVLDVFWCFLWCVCAVTGRKSAESGHRQISPTILRLHADDGVTFILHNCRGLNWNRANFRIWLLLLNNWFGGWGCTRAAGRFTCDLRRVLIKLRPGIEVALFYRAVLFERKTKKRHFLLGFLLRRRNKRILYLIWLLRLCFVLV